MDQQQPKSLTWGVGIIYSDGRPAVAIGPFGGISRDEADAIARTYQAAAEAEGGRVVVAPVNRAEAA